MADIEKTMKNLRARGFDASFFKSGGEAVDYLSKELSGETVGFGGSVTLESLGLFETLSKTNTVFWHWKQNRDEALAGAAAASVYLTSANAVAESGEIINIDGSGNRVVNSLYGKNKVYIIIGSNKIEESFDRALWRARNIAAPLNARRLNRDTPCVKGELKCYDCKSPDRICRGLVVLWNKMFGTDKAEVVIIDEKLGY